MTTPGPAGEEDLVWISHRGDTTSAPENTLEAYEAARDGGFCHLETDLRTTADGVLVLHHDPDLTRTAGVERKLASLSYAELEKIPLLGGGRVPRLDEFLQRFAALNWIFDMKPEQGLTTIDHLFQWIRRHDAREWIMAQARFLFWDRSQQNRFLELFPEACCLPAQPACYRAGLACLAGLPGLGGIRAGATYALPPRFLGLPIYRKSVIKGYHDRGGRVLAYLPDSEEAIREALAAGCDEFLLNGPLPGGAGRTPAG